MWLCGRHDACATCDSGFFSRFGMDDGRALRPLSVPKKNPGLMSCFEDLSMCPLYSFDVFPKGDHFFGGSDAQDKDLWDELRNRWAVPPVLLVLGLRLLIEAAFAWHDSCDSPQLPAFFQLFEDLPFLKHKENSGTMETLLCLTHEDCRTTTNHIENSNRHTEREGEDHLHEAMFLSV